MQSTMERDAFARRLREAMARIGDDGSSPTRLARSFNRRTPGAPVTLHAARKWLNGEAIPAQDKLRVLAAWLGVAADWLRYGDDRGSHYTVREPEQEIDYELLREIEALTPAHREAVRALVKALKSTKSKPS